MTHRPTVHSKKTLCRRIFILEGEEGRESLVKNTTKTISTLKMIPVWMFVSKLKGLGLAWLTLTLNQHPFPLETAIDQIIERKC